MAVSLTEKFQTLSSQHSPHVLAFDLGGTKFAAALFPVLGTTIQSSPNFVTDLPTKRGKKALQDTFESLVLRAVEYAQSHSLNILPHLSLGSPGRFIGEMDDIIAKGSCVNLETEPGEFDLVNMSALLAERLPAGYKLTVKNDAIAQMAAGIYLLKEFPQYIEQMDGEKLVYIGPGTGLGGGFCEFKNGACDFYSDGHVYDIKIEDETGNSVGAQDVFSGVAFEDRTGVSARDVNTSSDLFNAHLDSVVLMGEFLGKLVKEITLGTMNKTVDENNWPAADVNRASGSRVYLLGGSMGTKGEMGKVIQSTAHGWLEAEGINGTVFIPLPSSGDAGLLGAAQFLSNADISAALAQESLD